MTIEIRQDVLTHALTARFAATFDRPVPDRAAQQGVHWCLCTPQAPTGTLGQDGHPAAGGSFLPESDLPRRMWASSEIEFLRPIAVGEAIERRSSVADVKEKTGSSGNLLFVDVSHDVHAGGELAVRERQTIVYRPSANGSAAGPRELVFPAPSPDRGAQWKWQREIAPSTSLLFRYSALTFNSHRIHYDLDYAREKEGYPGLVVHGPLMATLLLDLCDRELGSNKLVGFGFRGVSPAFANEPLLLVGRPGDGDIIELAVVGADSRIVMTAKAGLAHSSV